MPKRARSDSAVGAGPGGFDDELDAIPPPLSALAASGTVSSALQRQATDYWSQTLKIMPVVHGLNFRLNSPLYNGAR